jgi:cephalosporin-C deacetylase
MNFRVRKRLPFMTLAISIAVLGACRTCMAQSLTVTPDEPSGVYAVGDTVHWTVTWSGTGSAPDAHYVLKSGGYTQVGSGDLTFADGLATLESKFSAAGTLLLEVDWHEGFSKGQVLAGAVAAPFSIEPAAPPPADFDSFWASKISEVKKIPANPQLVSDDSETSEVSYWKVTLDNIGGAHVQGQIARPTAGRKFPAILQLQYAGVYGLQKTWVTGYAKAGWLAMDIEAHDLPVDQTPDYYTTQQTGPLRNYWNIGNDDREKSYYLAMYLGCYQAIEYLAHRPDWNGKTLVVTGQSQGGQQTLMIAGLHPQYITAAMALVPAACDMLAPDLGRASGFPNWYFNTQGKDAQQVRRASLYYDPINFARNIRCPVLIALGLHDDIAPPSSILAAVDVITAPKEVLILPNSGHEPVNGSQDAYYNAVYKSWLPALALDKPAPVSQVASDSP